MAPEITSIESVEFAYPIEDVGTDQHGFNLVYGPGSVTERKLFGIKIHTDEGITGEYVGGNLQGTAQINTFADFAEECLSVGYGSDDSDMLETVDDDGTVEVPNGPGRGVDYNWTYLEDNATGSIHIYN